MKSIRRQTVVRIGRTAGLFGAGLVAAIACKSFSIDETVYTGASTSRAGSSSGGNHPSSGGSASVAGRAGSTSSEGGDVGFAGDSASGGSVAAAGSGPVEPEIPAEPFTKAAFLRQVAECTVNRYQDFHAQAVAFDSAVQALDAAPSEKAVAQARAAWLSANTSLQALELFRFGPAGRTAEADAGGQELRDQIYSWPLGGRCPVETALVDKLYAASDFSSSLVDVRGMGAAEYLLFYEPADNGCQSFAAINTNGSWAALGASEIALRKRHYAAAVSGLVLASAEQAFAAWDPTRGNFKAKLTSPGAGSPYPDQQAALNVVFHGIFYLEKEVKDFKLAVPLARSPACFAALCPEALEARFAKVSLSNLKLNFRAFRRLFQGCGANDTGLGFDDWLDAVGASALRIRMLDALDGAENALDDVTPPLEDSLLVDAAHAQFLYDQLKVFTDIFKTEFISTLNLDLPPGAGTDND